MVIGIGTAFFRIAGSKSLKDKRRVLKSIITRLHNRFNIAVAEVGHQDSRQEAEIGVACISNEAAHADKILAAVMRFLEAEGEIELLTYNTELI
ncbi:MAG: uncharacterized protein PWP31_790 [Clostridia bacterium]|nr:uncharacterized protein [Clostridia bacterium]